MKGLPFTWKRKRKDGNRSEKTLKRTRHIIHKGGHVPFSGWNSYQSVTFRMTFDCFDWFFLWDLRWKKKQLHSVGACLELSENGKLTQDLDWWGMVWLLLVLLDSCQFLWKLQGNPKISWLIIICPREKKHNQPRIHKVRPFTGGLPIVILNIS
jgi:hypothetical protein